MAYHELKYTGIQKRKRSQMSMADSPVQVYQGGTLAQSILSSAPDGMLIAPAWKRVAAFATDVILIVLVIQLLTQGLFLATIPKYGLVLEGGQTTMFFIVNWVILFGSHYLYFKYTGRRFGRSLGQRAFRIAIVHDNGTALEIHHWGPRAISKILYLIPILGWLWFGVRDFFEAQLKSAEYRTHIDKKHNTVAAVDWSLPIETRHKLG
jgi:uncharacterized RDD family membrane protein YckC